MQLGRYDLLLPLARGGMADVWAARQSGELGFQRIVAVKTIRADRAGSASFREMFLDEARIAARIRHANVVEVLDLGEDGSIVFQALTLIEGDTLGGLARRWRTRGREPGLPPAMVLRIMADAMSGLHAAHEVTDEDGASIHLVHRDVSPQNILVGVDGVSRIADFGVAKALGRLADDTEVGHVKGKFGYMAPELLAGRPPDRRSDVFSAGVVLWEALTGAPLFRGADVIRTLARLSAFEVPDPRDLVRDLPDAVAAVTLRALDRAPERRYATAAEASDALDAAAREAGFAASPKGLATFVTDLAGPDVEWQREAIRSAVRVAADGAPSEIRSVASSEGTPEALDGTTTIPVYAVDETGID